MSLFQFFKLSTVDKRLLTKALLLVWLVRLGLWLLPFRTLRRLLAKLARGGKSVQTLDVDRVAWSVSVTSKYVPAATCLTQALVTRFLLKCCGHQASVRIGVARGDSGEFQAHAWVEINGGVVIGGSAASLKQYTPLTPWNEE